MKKIIWALVLATISMAIAFGFSKFLDPNNKLNISNTQETISSTKVNSDVSNKEVLAEETPDTEEVLAEETPDTEEGRKQERDVLIGSLKTNNDELIFSILLVLFILIMLFLAISNYKLLSWKSRHNNRLVSFPEALQDQFSESIGASKNAMLIMADFMKRMRESEQKNTERFNDLLNSFSSLQKELEEKSSEIDRLKKGYDTQISKKYSKRFIKILSTCEDLVRETNSEEALREIGYIRDDIMDALDLADVRSFDIKEGSNTKDKSVFGMPQAGSWIKVQTSDATKFFLVKSCLEDGYYLDAEIKEIIQYPKIEVYIEEKKDE